MKKMLASVCFMAFIAAVVVCGISVIQGRVVMTASADSEATTEIIDLDAIIKAAVEKALAEAAQCNPCTTEAQAEVKQETAEIVVVEETKTVFPVGEKLTAMVALPLFSGNGIMNVWDPDTQLPSSGLIRDQRNTPMAQFASYGKVVGNPTASFITEKYAEVTEVTYEYVAESDVEFADLLEAVTVHTEFEVAGQMLRFFSLRAEKFEGQQEIVRFWLSQNEAEYWTICLRADGTYVVLTAGQAFTASQQKSYQDSLPKPQPASDPKPANENEPDPQFDPIVLPPKPGPDPDPTPEPNPEFDPIVLPPRG